MNQPRPQRRTHKSLVHVALTAMALAAFVGAACGDDEAAVLQPVGGGGTGGTGTGNEIGGFMQGPGPGSGAGGSGTGGEGNQGGTGEPAFEWDNVYGDTVIDNIVHPTDVAIDTLGNIVVVGSFRGTVDLGGGVGNELTSNGEDDVFVAKYTSAGAHIWSIGAGDGNVQAALSVTTDGSANIWVSGTVKGTFAFPGGTNLTNGNDQFPNAWIAKLDANGGAQFAASYGQNADYSDYGRAVAAGPGNQVVFAGTFQNNITFASAHTSVNGSYSMFLARYDEATNVTLDRTFGDGLRQDANAVAVAVDGSIAIGGSTEGNVNFGGGELVNSSGGGRAVVAKLDAAGNEVFAMLFESGGVAEVKDVAFHNNGDLFVTGYFSQTIDLGGGELTANGAAREIFIGRYDTNGNLIYGSRFGGVGADEPAGIAVDTNSFAAVAGRFTDDIVVNGETTLDWDSTVNDAFLIRVGPPGQGYWGYQAQALNTARATGIAIDPSDDRIVVVGEYTDQIDLGSGPVGGGHLSGMFLSKYAPGD